MVRLLLDRRHPLLDACLEHLLAKLRIAMTEGDDSRKKLIVIAGSIFAAGIALEIAALLVWWMG
jgi:hypothetical protein